MPSEIGIPRRNASAARPDFMMVNANAEIPAIDRKEIMRQNALVRVASMGN